MKKIIPLFFLILIVFTSCNLSMFDQGILDGTIPGTVPDESIPERPVEFSYEAPKNVTATEAYYTDRIIVNWSAVTGASYYTVERAEISTLSESVTNWVELALDVSSKGTTQFIDTDRNLQEGKYYAYRVTAHAAGGISGETSEVCYGSILAPPSNISISQGDSFDKITITWTQMPGVSQYHIYKASSSESAGLGTAFASVSQQSSINYDEVELTNSYTYEVNEDEKGLTLYFVIKSSGPYGTDSQSSIVRSGYTRVIGAAETPEISSITKGSSVSSVTITWAKDPSDTEDDPISYTIRRTSPGSAETTIFPLYSGQTLEPDENGNFSITDTNVTDRTVYTYSIIASNSVGMSQAAIETGYLLSQPEGIVFSPDTENKEYYVSSFTLPVGGDEEGNEDWTYDVSFILEDGSVTDPESMTRDALESYVSKTSISTSGAVDFNKEARRIRIYTVNGTVVSETYLEAIIGGIPDAVSNAAASANMSTSESANSEGVYPVFVTWTQSGDYPAYSYSVNRTDGGFYSETEELSAMDSDVSLGELYTYEITAYDPFGRHKDEIATTNEGYGAITGQQFRHIFESNILKPWEYLSEHPEYNIGGSKGEIYRKISAQGLGSLAKDGITYSGKTINVDNSSQSGTITYIADQEGIGGIVTFRYTKYFSETSDYLFYINGDFYYEMHVSMSGDGSVAAPSDFVTGGLFPATISFSRLSVSGNAFTGNYRITQHHSNGDATYEVSSR